MYVSLKLQILEESVIYVTLLVVLMFLCKTIIYYDEKISGIAKIEKRNKQTCTGCKTSSNE